MKAIKEQLKKEIKMLFSGMAGQDSVIGLDLGLSGFRAVRSRAGIKEIPLKDILIQKVQGLKDLASQMKIEPDEEVCINFRGEHLAIRRASIPLMPKEEIEEALRWELKEQVQFDISKAKIKFDILGEKENEDGSKKIELIAICYKEKEIEEKIKELKGLGLNVQGVFPSDFALAEYVNNQKIILPQEKVGLVDIGRAKTTIGIIENKRLCFARDVSIGGDTITEAMTDVLISDKGRIEFSNEEAERLKHEHGVSEDIRILSMMRPVLEKLSNQIKRSLEYYEHRFDTDAVRKIILAGSGSKLKGLKDYLSRETGFDIVDALPETACAIGLALIRDSGLNLLPEKFRVRKRTALKEISLRMVSLVAALLFLVSYGLLSIKAINLNNKVDVYRSHWQNIKDVKSIKDEITLFSHAIDTISYENIEIGKIIKELSNLVPPFVMLDNLAIKDTEPNVKVSGFILKGDKLSEFMSDLENSSMLERVRLVFSEKNKDYSSGALDFEITCNITR